MSGRLFIFNLTIINTSKLMSLCTQYATNSKEKSKLFVKKIKNINSLIKKLFSLISENS